MNPLGRLWVLGFFIDVLIQLQGFLIAFAPIQSIGQSLLGLDIRRVFSEHALVQPYGFIESLLPGTDSRQCDPDINVHRVARENVLI